MKKHTLLALSCFLIESTSWAKEGHSLEDSSAASSSTTSSTGAPTTSATTMSTTTARPLSLPTGATTSSPSSIPLGTSSSSLERMGESHMGESSGTCNPALVEVVQNLVGKLCSKG